MSFSNCLINTYRHLFLTITCLVGLLIFAGNAIAQKTVKPVLHGKHWVAVTGKPLAATAGAMIFTRGGNAVDAACAMLAATSTMWDTLGWGGETQALIYNPHTGEVKGINALGVAPSGATAEFFQQQGMVYPPEFGPLAAVTPGTPGGLMVMLAEYGKLSLAQVLAPAMQIFTTRTPVRLRVSMHWGLHRAVRPPSSSINRVWSIHPSSVRWRQ